MSSKKKKQAKLKRVMQTVKKHERKAGMHPAEAFAAMQLLHDPQVPHCSLSALHVSDAHASGHRCLLPSRLHQHASSALSSVSAAAHLIVRI